jgi:hypothetical protein
LELDAERKILLKRFYYTDRSLFNLGSALQIPWFESYRQKFSRDTYAYLTPEEKIEAIETLCKHPDDMAFVSALNSVERPTFLDIDVFLGERYYFDGTTFSAEDRRQKLRGDVRAVIKETKGRIATVLKAIISLYRSGRWDKAYGGAAWPDILANIREMRESYPSPRDLAILKSYKIYFKTGSRRYPTHTVPEEMIPTIWEVLIEPSILSMTSKLPYQKSQTRKQRTSV